VIDALDEDEVTGAVGDALVHRAEGRAELVVRAVI